MTNKRSMLCTELEENLVLVGSGPCIQAASITRFRPYPEGERRQQHASAQPIALLIAGNFLSASVGIRAVCEDLAVHLVGRGWSVITTSAKVPRAARLADMIATVWRRRHDYQVANVDVYSGSAFFWAEAVCWTLRRAGKPYVLTLRGGNLPYFAGRWSWRVRKLLSSAHAITTPSAYLLSWAAKYSPHVHLLPNPLDVRAYQFRLRDSVQPDLVWLRAFHDTYNPSLAAKALALLVPECPNIRLTMIGPDKNDGSLQVLQRTARELQVTERIVLPGGVPKPDVPRWLNAGDIFLNTTNVDNAPVSVIEAMACGLCVVSTNVGGMPHLIEHERDGLLVPPNDPPAMAVAIKRVLMDTRLASGLSERARQKALQYDWTAVVPKWEALLIDAAARKQAALA